MPASPMSSIQCMEVWGGNEPADRRVTLDGLDVWVYSRPYGAADGGGDVYYVSSCATGRITRLLVADVSGHGAEVCDVAAQLRGLMRKYVNYLDQGQFVQSMNGQFSEMARNGSFATALVSTFFAPSRYLSLCNAGHPPPLLYRAGTQRWGFLEESDGRHAGNIPFGIEDATAYEQFDVPLEVGDLVLFYTDSLPESRVPGGELLGQERLLETVRQLDVSNPARIIPVLLEAIAKLADGNLLGDDVTAMLFRPNGAGGVRLRDRLLAPVRILGSIAASLRTKSVPAALPDFSLANIGGAIFSPLGRLWRGRRALSRHEISGSFSRSSTPSG